MGLNFCALNGGVVSSVAKEGWSCAKVEKIKTALKLTLSRKDKMESKVEVTLSQYTLYVSIFSHNLAAHVLRYTIFMEHAICLHLSINLETFVRSWNPSRKLIGFKNALSYNNKMNIITCGPAKLNRVVRDNGRAWYHEVVGQEQSSGVWKNKLFRIPKCSDGCWSTHPLTNLSKIMFTCLHTS